MRAFDVTGGDCGARHAEIVAENRALKLEFLAQHVFEPDPGITHRHRVNCWKQQVGRHHALDTGRRQKTKRHQIPVAEGVQIPAIDRQLVMRIAGL